MKYTIPKFQFVTINGEQNSYLFMGPFGDIIETDPQTGKSRKIKDDKVKEEPETCSCCHCKSKTKTHFMRG